MPYWKGWISTSKMIISFLDCLRQVDVNDIEIDKNKNFIETAQ
jgi:hypothetical protein